jgi:hypothetical protein
MKSPTRKKKNTSKGSRTEKEKEEDLMIQEREIAYRFGIFARCFCYEKVNLRHAAVA